MTVTGAPEGFSPGEIGAGACPDTGPPGQLCANPQYSLSGPGGRYTLSLSPGSWRVAGFYETSAFGGPFLGTAQVIDVPSGGTVVRNLTVPYSAPAELKGTITVTGVPPTLQVEQLMVLVCPSYAPYTGGSQPIACVNGYAQPSSPGATSAPYDITGLPPGSWTAYPGFCAQTGCGFNQQAGVPVTLSAGKTTTANLSTPFLLPGQALLSGTVTVLDAPSGFSDPVGVSACHAGTSNCQTFYVPSGDQFDLVLQAGVYSVKGFYLASPFDNAVDGPSAPITLRAGHDTVRNLSVTYRVPGTATGSINVSGFHLGVTITAYTVLACPTLHPWSGGIPAPECVSEYSGPGGFGYGAADRSTAQGPFALTHPPAGFKGSAVSGPVNRYVLPLTPGPWLLYPGYQTVFGSVVDHTATTVKIASNVTTHKNLTVPYQRPTQAAVTGTVNVVGAPANGFESGVQACTAPPTATTCTGEQEAYGQQNGAYTMLLTPGTWWVRGFVQTFFGFSSHQSTSSAVVVHARAGVVSKENFTVTVS
ncbi:MAG TPA: hypothetical protein VG346_08145 [Acidimicrobiales bacterium]|nr:hypothetical protein [Acidimicrobiales bacterium]